jgi:hypothetical protein
MQVSWCQLLRAPSKPILADNLRVWSSSPRMDSEILGHDGHSLPLCQCSRHLEIEDVTVWSALNPCVESRKIQA